MEGGIQKNYLIFCTKIIVYVKTLVKIIFLEFLLNAFIAKKLLVCVTFLHRAELFPVLGMV